MGKLDTPVAAGTRGCRKGPGPNHQGPSRASDAGANFQMQHTTVDVRINTLTNDNTVHLSVNSPLNSFLPPYLDL